MLQQEPIEAMRAALLRGRHVTPLGVIDAIGEGPAAIALSRGGASKSYSYVDPNEDTAGFAIGPGGALAVVADGHFGCEASEVAVAALLERWAPLWTQAGPAGDASGAWEVEAREALLDCHRAILTHVATGGTSEARTTLCFALARPHDDLIGFGAIGDSHLFQVGGPEVVELAFDDERRNVYLGHPQDDADSLPAKLVVGREKLAGTRALVLATDGLSERGIGVDVPELAVAEVAARAAGAPPDRRPLELARGVVEEALAAQRRQRSGDNVATAVIWIGP